MDEKARWTNLKPWLIAKLLENEYDIRVSLNVIRQLLKSTIIVVVKPKNEKPRKM